MILLTGAAGFIGFHTAQALLARGERVLGLDSLNDYYDPALKKARLAQLEAQENFRFIHADIADRAAVGRAMKEHGITAIIHLAAQAGVRHSLEHPYAYGASNLDGQLVMLEAARHCAGLRHFVYASSSSVYGGNEKQPFSTADRVETPLSLYAATKRAGELMAQSYSHLYRIPATGLRFFTVYGPWGRPDMAYYAFTRAILAGEPITLFNDGDMKRDFTWIVDCVSGILGALDHPPGEDARHCLGGAPHRLFNIGNHRAEKLGDFVAAIEAAAGRRAEKILAPMAPGDVRETYADIAPAREVFGFDPATPVAEGIARFVAWYKDYHRAEAA
jgi:UDP-glucuronate 4-epimerase